MPSNMTHTVLFLCTGNYYRSRFAELVFNQRARTLAVSWRADSAGLRPELFSCNPGHLSDQVVCAAHRRGLRLETPHRPPRAATSELLNAAARIVALDRSEHEPLVTGRFPDVAHRVLYWNVKDVADTPPDVALPSIEAAVFELVDALATARR